MVLLFLFAFISGIATILSPCIWPILPIVLSSASQKGHKRPLGVTLGIILSFAIFTLSISYLIKIFNFNPNSLRIFAVIIIAFLGITMFVPKINYYLEILISRLTSKFGGNLQNTKSGFTPGFITGFALGAVWSPCAGPILAAVATLAATSQIGISSILITIAYVIGVGIPLLVIGYGGQQLITKTRGISKYTGKIQQAFGIVMILTAIAIYYNLDQILQVKLLEKFPQLDASVTLIEDNKTVQTQLDELTGTQTLKESKGSDLTNYGAAPEFTGIVNWLNTNGEPLTMAELKGKVVLIDFWTYTCINCVRTLPYITSWYDKYEDDNFVVIGVHTPEFAFEKETANVQNAINRHNTNYPVAQDNNYETWRAYNNRYWPAKYLIDSNGDIRYVHFGEGAYKETEEAIRKLIEESGTSIDDNELTDLEDNTPRIRTTPELYLGYQRMEYYFPTAKAKLGVNTYEHPEQRPVNSFSLGGTWEIENEYSKAVEDASLELRFRANKVFLVLKPGEASGNVRVLLDGNVVNSENAGSDVEEGIVNVTQDELYSLIDLGDEEIKEHLLRLEFENGIEVYAFTFGD